jgi:hypothetical protein
MKILTFFYRLCPLYLTGISAYSVHDYPAVGLCTLVVATVWGGVVIGKTLDDIGQR